MLDDRGLRKDTSRSAALEYVLSHRGYQIRGASWRMDEEHYRGEVGQPLQLFAFFVSARGDSLEE